MSVDAIAQVREYAEYIGLDIKRFPSLLWIAEEGLNCPLPAGWRVLRQGDEHYFRHDDGRTQSDHPNDPLYRSLAAKETEKIVQAQKQEALRVEEEERKKREQLAAAAAAAAVPLRVQDLSEPSSSSPSPPSFVAATTAATTAGPRSAASTSRVEGLAGPSDVPSSSNPMTGGKSSSSSGSQPIPPSPKVLRAPKDANEPEDKHALLWRQLRFSFYLFLLLFVVHVNVSKWVFHAANVAAGPTANEKEGHTTSSVVTAEAHQAAGVESGSSNSGCSAAPASRSAPQPEAVPVAVVETIQPATVAEAAAEAVTSEEDEGGFWSIF